MNKEKAITIFIGLLLGAIIAGGYFYWTKFRTIDIIPNRIEEPQENNNSNEEQTLSTDSPILITLPQDNISVTADTITIGGITKASSQVVIFANAEEKVITSDSEGKFETTLELEDGENVVTATLVDSDGKLYTDTRTVTLEVGN